MKLERSRIVGAALALLDEVGIDELTTRRLADRLGVRQPALYWHFKSKRALLDAMNAEMLRRHHTYDAPAPGDDWKTFLTGNARSFRRALLAYRDGGRVHAGTEAAEENLGRIESQLACLVDAGFPMRLAMHALVSISRLVLGSVIDEQADAQDNDERRKQDLDAAAGRLPLLREALEIYRRDGHGQTFETGLAVFVSGLERKLEQARRPAAATGAIPSRKLDAPLPSHN